MNYIRVLPGPREEFEFSRVFDLSHVRAKEVLLYIQMIHTRSFLLSLHAK